MTHIFGLNGPIHSVFFNMCGTRRGIFQNHFQLCIFYMAPSSDEKVDFFQKVGPESVPAGRVNVDEIFRNFIFKFYWTKRSLKKR